MISTKTLKEKMHAYFVQLIEAGKQEVDILECNAELQKIISRIPKTNEWIPIDERLPENDDYILLSFENFSLPSVGRYEGYPDGSGAFFLGDEDIPIINYGVFVNAWKPLPASYGYDKTPEWNEKMMQQFTEVK